MQKFREQLADTTMLIQSRLVLCCVLCGVAGCPSPEPPDTARNPDAIAKTFTKAAEHIYSDDWIGFDIPLSKIFSAEELAILGEHLPSLESMINNALGKQDSVWGAQLAGHFRLSEALPRLRNQFLTPRRCYGWEGPDYSKLESFLMDGQFQYSVAYMEAIEAITGNNIAEALEITESELTRIEFLSAHENSQFYHWALWTKRKLNI